MAQTKKGLNQVRIGGGEWRSRLLRFPDAPGLRPTPDRVRETLFNWLGQDLTGLSCLDLFAGTGVMGFEALSRGALKTIMVEKSAVAYQALLSNQKILNADSAQIFHMDALAFLKRNQETFDIVFLDPPYNLGFLDKALPLISAQLNSEAYVYAEAEYLIKSDEIWDVLKQGKAGAVFYHLLKKR